MKALYGWEAFCTIVIRDCRRTFRVWKQSFLPSIVTTILYFVIFGRVMGQRIGYMDHFPYIQYIAPGLIMMQVITNAYNGGVSSFFFAKFQKQIQELLVSPISANVMVLGYTSSAIIRGIIAGIMVSVLALLFTHLHIYSLLILIAVTLCSSTLFALAGLINAIFAQNFDDIAIVPTFILAPLTYLGGVFYSITSLPKPWQFISWINPITYIIDTFRFGFLGVGNASMSLAFAIMIGLIVILFIFAKYLINYGGQIRE